MLTFFLRRLLSLPPLLFVISLLTFLLLQAAPGDFYSRMESDTKYSFDYVMSLRNAVGRVVAVPPEKRAAEIGEFSVGARRFSFAKDGQLLRERTASDPKADEKAVEADPDLKKWIPADPKLEQEWVKRFHWPESSSDLYTITDKGATYRWVGKFHGYVIWLGKVLSGDLGESWSKKAPVGAVMWDRVKNTMLLEVVALFIAWGLAIPLGVWSGVKPNSLIDHVCGAVAYMSISVPTVFLSLLALLFALSTKTFPVGDLRDTHWGDFTAWHKFSDIAWHVTLPALVVGLTSIAIYMRQMRGQMVETMSSDYVRTARAKGVSQNKVMFKHALRNAINPLVTLFGFSLAGLLSGSVLVEIVFNWPGIAQVTVQAVFEKDEPLVMASVLFATIVLVMGNLFADVLLALVDPKIRQA